MTSDSIVTRLCDRCNAPFKVPVRQPNRTTCFRHCGANRRPHVPAGADPVEAANARAIARRELDRKIARNDLQRVAREIVVQIDRADDALESARAQVLELTTLKDNLVARHALLQASIDAFTHLIEHTEISYMRELETAKGESHAT